MGGSVTIDLEDLSFSVPAGGRVDFVVPLDNGIVPDPAIQYTTSASWTTPVDPSSLRVRERGVSFLSQSDQVLVAAITDTAEPALADGLTWILNDDGMATGWEVSNKQLTGLPEDFAFVDHYHGTIDGLPDGESITLLETCQRRERRSLGRIDHQRERHVRRLWRRFHRRSEFLFL